MVLDANKFEDHTRSFTDSQMTIWYLCFFPFISTTSLSILLSTGDPASYSSENIESERSILELSPSFTCSHRPHPLSSTMLSAPGSWQRVVTPSLSTLLSCIISLFIFLCIYYYFPHLNSGQVFKVATTKICWWILCMMENDKGFDFNYWGKCQINFLVTI